MTRTEAASLTVTPAVHIDWNGYTHQELYGMIMSANPQTIQERAQAVHEFAQDMHDVTGFVHDTAQNMFGLWHSPAAQQAAQTINQVTRWADHTAETASVLAHSLGQYADALNEARDTMPEPINWGAVNKALSGGTVHLSTSGVNAATIDAIAQGHHLNTPQAQQKESANKAKAVAVMEKYHATATSIYHGTPTFTDPPGITSVPIDPVEQPPVWPPVGSTWPPTSGPTGPGHKGGDDTTTTSSAAPVSTIGTAPRGLSPVGAGNALGNGSGPGLAALGGPGSGGLVNDEGGWGGFGSSGGVGATASGPIPNSSGAQGAASGAAEDETAGSRAAVAAEGDGEAGWGGFGPMGGRGPGSGGDLEHRDRYSVRADVIGDLPEAFPPVLGL